MPVLNITYAEIYKEVRSFLLGLFPGSELQVVQAAQFENDNPLPVNAVVMQILFDTPLDQPSVTFLPPTEAAIQNSTEVRFQIDFYGAMAGERSRVVANLWRSGYACERLNLCQPLYVQSHRRLPYINESKQYEDRWITDLGLQYNPQVNVAQDYTDRAGVTIKPVPGD